MRPSQVVLITLLVGPLAAGCLPGRRDGDAVHAARRLRGAPDGLVRLDVAVIERPAGDRYLNRTLWDLADEQAVDLERKPALDDNGFRVGLIGGLLPTDLLALLTSDRSCAEPHRIQLRADSSTRLPVGGERPKCRFTLQQGGRVAAVNLDDACCQLEIMPTPAEGGRLTLRFTPLVKHGASRREARAVREPSGEHRWDMEVRQPVDCYTALSWQVTVGPDDYVVIGTRLDRDGTLGQCFFLDESSAQAVQRLLVVRSGRVMTDGPPTDPLAPPPLALQASWRTARGSAPGTVGRP
jgi:hypothetical protein